MRRTLSVFAAATFLSASVDGAEHGPNLVTIQTAGAKLRALMRGLPPPEPSDEPARKKEPGQTFDEYLASNPNRPNRTRPAFYLRIIGELNPGEDRLVDEIERFLRIAYGTPFKRAEAIPVASIPRMVSYEPDGWGGRGFLATRLLDRVVAPQRPKDAASVLALTAQFLWTGEGIKTVFGRASFEKNVAAMTLGRFGNLEPDGPIVLGHALKVASHEVAHTLGVFHCLEFECGMNETNSLGDLDRRPLAFCSECEMKVWWACRLDPAGRTQELLDYCERRQLSNAAADYRRRLQVIPKRR
jgi:archaemetzincin